MWTSYPFNFSFIEVVTGASLLTWVSLPLRFSMNCFSNEEYFLKNHLAARTRISTPIPTAAIVQPDRFILEQTTPRTALTAMKALAMRSPMTGSAFFSFSFSSFLT